MPLLYHGEAQDELEHCSHGGGNLKPQKMCRHMKTILDRHFTQFEHVLQAILDIKIALESKTDLVSLVVGLLRVDDLKLVEQVDNAESALTGMHSTVQYLQTQVKEKKAANVSLQHTYL
ncbi:hypothetical protein NDU88_010934 [Pleurodeles waltl]|uniref:Uncharacterized protein n=1 Tax=Pleurodeles waltl TaxID=8319 RepID=A0AAV7RZM2_PLEWA|nr:hypothetical protein NDU88_010934 [Pleurodeles waltl]